MPLNSTVNFAKAIISTGYNASPSKTMEIIITKWATGKVAVSYVNEA